MFQKLSELTTNFIHQVIEESEEINEFKAESRPLVCANFMRLYSALCYVERYSQEFNAELHAIAKRETPLVGVVLRSKNEKLFTSIENFNFQLLNLEYLGNHHIHLFRERNRKARERNRKAVWHYPDEWRIDLYNWLFENNYEADIMKRRYALYPLILTSPTVELSKQIAILKYPTKIPTANMQEEIIAKLPVDMVDLRGFHSDKLSFRHCVNRGACGAYEYILSGEGSYRILVNSIYNLLEMQEIDLLSTTMVESFFNDTQSSIEAITKSKHALSYFIKQNFKLDDILI